MTTSYLVMLVYIANCFIHAESVKCIKCSVTEYDSPCRLGTEENLFECPSDEQSCYAEYFYGGDKPLYRRGCSPSDWCDTQKKVHSDDFKYCKTCDGEKCNTDIIGAPDKSQLQCYTCSSNDYTEACRTGSIDNKMELCKQGETQCSYHYISTSQRTIWERGCAENDHCSKLDKKYGSNSVQKCETCAYDLCNTKGMAVVYM